MEFLRCVISEINLRNDPAYEIVRIQMFRGKGVNRTLISETVTSARFAAINVNTIGSDYSYSIDKYDPDTHEWVHLDWNAENRL